ncbi:hypothetical protein G5B30_16650 [Sphingobacterium sp. SGG-5]|uniref:hypothetical protein n=1 Tax=Sphingobacterium sp. SGG-5 TaxID=2710881 RepID=UPI0013E99EC4|nr:hypothetical protein [Sphingobacterium sp. SGG-5]NGM63541.1 hypothetical protein [Sphingobacterium sp. SGG-5]
MILVNDSAWYEDFDECLENKLSDFDTLDEEDFVIEYQECKKEPCIDWSIEDIVENMMYERDTEDGDYYQRVVDLIKRYTDVNAIRREMPELYYPKMPYKVFDLKELDQYKEFIKEQDGGNNA